MFLIFIHYFWEIYSPYKELKGQLISKADKCAIDSPKKTNGRICFQFAVLLRAEICFKMLAFLEDLKTPKFHFEINWPLDTYDHIDDRGQIKPRRISHNWTAPVSIICIQCTAQEGHNWWWSIQNETAFEILMSENLPRRLHFFCLETCHVVYLLASVRLWSFSMVGCGQIVCKIWARF